MSEIVDNRKVFSLFEVAKSVKETLSKRYTSSFWVKAEMNKLNFHEQSGHCFPELVDKNDGKIIAQLKATIWSSDYSRINRNFLQTLNEPLKNGIKILFNCAIQFDELHGFSLHILDIDPNYTLGDLEREKKETIKKLKEENIFNKNKQIPFPLIPQRIAVISAINSKGYLDFVNILDQNPFGYKFFHHLFEAKLQGDDSPSSIIKQLDIINKLTNHFDVIAIIRGGGGDVGLSSFNDYNLSRKIAQFPLPVLTGIGHSTNETVAELVSHKSEITPTKIAEFLIQKFHNLIVPLNDIEKKFKLIITNYISTKKDTLSHSIRYFRASSITQLTKSHSTLANYTHLLTTFYPVFKKNNISDLSNLNLLIKKDVLNILSKSQTDISHATNFLNTHTLNSFTEYYSQLNNSEYYIKLMNPDNVLKRGYSITTLNGKSFNTVDKIKPNDIIKTKLFEGEIISTVNKTSK